MDFKKLMIIGGIPACLGVILLFSRAVVTFADMPNRVETIEKYVEQQQRANEVQAQANALMQQQIQNKQQTIEYYLADDGYYYTKDGLYWWDKENQQWKAVR